MGKIMYGNAPHSCNDACLMNDDECTFLKTIVQNKKVIEIGSFRGGSAKLMAPVCRELLCIDPHNDLDWAGEGTTKGIDIQSDFLAVIRGYPHVHYLQMYSDDAIGFIKPFYYNVLLVDGEHSYTQCLKDLTNYIYLMHTSKDRIILVHDYCLMFSGVIAACNTYFNRLPDELIGTLAVYKLKAGVFK